MKQWAVRFLCSGEGRSVGTQRSCLRRSTKAANGFESLRRSAQQGFTLSRRSAQQGFTLIEMLVALMIFGMLTAAGVALLSVSARTQQTSDRLLAEFGQVRRLSALLTADLGQAAARMHRDAEGRPQRAFAGADGQDDTLLLFVRRGPSTSLGTSGDDGESGAGPQRVGYRLAEGQLQRVAFSRIDGAGRATVSPLIERVRSVRLRYRDERGDWRPSWADPDPTRLPAAVELVVDSARYGPIRMVFTVGGTR